MCVNKIYLRIFLMFSIIMSFGCGNDDDGCSTIDVACPEFDQCEYLRQNPLTADFSHVDATYDGSNTTCTSVVEITESDTSYFGLHTFRAKYRPTNLNSVDISYEWQFGSDPNVRTGEVVELFFNENVGPSVNVTLTTTINSSNCSEFDSATVSSSKVMRLIDADISPSKLLGRYEGNNDNEGPERVIRIARYLNGFQYGINNLFDNCPSNQEGNTLFVGLNYKHLLIPESNSDGCKFTCGSGKLSEDNNTITINYTTRSDDGTETDHQFIGTRIED